MANLFRNLPLPVLNGAGAAVDCSTLGTPKTIEIVGTFPKATIIVEISNDGGIEFAPLVVFQNSGAARIMFCAAQWMRVNVSGRKTSLPFTADCDVAAPEDIGALYAAIALPAGDGPGAATDISAFQDLATIVCGGVFAGANILLEISGDGLAWAPLFSFSGQGGQKSVMVTANFIRANVSGRKGPVPFSASLSIGAVSSSDGGAGLQVEDEGVALAGAPFTILNFTGAGVAATNAGGGQANIDVPGGVGAWNVRGPFVAPALAAISDLMEANTTGGAFTFTVPAIAAGNKGGQIAFKKVAGGSTNFTITPAGADTIDGIAGAYTVPGALSSVTLVSDGTSNWMVI